MVEVGAKGEGSPCCQPLVLSRNGLLRLSLGVVEDMIRDFAAA